MKNIERKNSLPIFFFNFSSSDKFLVKTHVLHSSRNKCIAKKPSSKMPQRPAADKEQTGLGKFIPIGRAGHATIFVAPRQRQRDHVIGFQGQEKFEIC